MGLLQKELWDSFRNLESTGCLGQWVSGKWRATVPGTTRDAVGSLTPRARWVKTVNLEAIGVAKDWVTCRPTAD